MVKFLEKGLDHIEHAILVYLKKFMFFLCIRHNLIVPKLTVW